MREMSIISVIGIDLGGSHISFVVMNQNYDILDKHYEIVNDRSTEAVIALIINNIRILISKNSNVKGIGIGIPGNVDPITNSTRYLPNFGWMTPVPIGYYYS